MAEPHNPHHATDDADADAVAYLRGDQEINEQRSTWDLFMNLAKWGSLAIAVAVLFLTLWFTPGGNFMAGFIAAVVLAGAGWFFLKGKPEAH